LGNIISPEMFVIWITPENQAQVTTFEYWFAGGLPEVTVFSSIELLG
jgi:hypothetical protein